MWSYHRLQPLQRDAMLRDGIKRISIGHDPLSDRLELLN
jgi:hypothetical protein